MKKSIIAFILILVAQFSQAQSGSIKGKVINSINNEAIPFASVGITSISKAAQTDIDGNYLLEGLNPGLYNVSVSFVGFANKTVFEIQVNN